MVEILRAVGMHVVVNGEWRNHAGGAMVGAVHVSVVATVAVAVALWLLRRFRCTFRIFGVRGDPHEPLIIPATPTAVRSASCWDDKANANGSNERLRNGADEVGVLVGRAVICVVGATVTALIGYWDERDGGHGVSMAFRCGMVAGTAAAAKATAVTQPLLPPLKRNRRRASVRHALVTGGGRLRDDHGVIGASVPSTTISVVCCAAFFLLGGRDRRHDRDAEPAAANV